MNENYEKPLTLSHLGVYSEHEISSFVTSTTHSDKWVDGVDWKPMFGLTPEASFDQINQEARTTKNDKFYIITSVPKTTTIISAVTIHSHYVIEALVHIFKGSWAS